MGHNVIRRSINAGVALAAVGALTWGAVPTLVGDQVTPAAPRVVVADVVPTANALETLAVAVVDTFRASGHALTSEVPELWKTVQDDWIDERLTGRNYGRVAELFLLPVVPFVSGPFTHAVADVLTDAFPQFSGEIDGLVEAVQYVAIRVVGPLLSAFAGAGEAHAGIFRPMTTWDIPGFVEAVVKAPVYVIDGLLNGGYGDLGPLLGQGFDGNGTVIAPPGLFTPWGATVTPRNIDGPLPTAARSTATAPAKASTTDTSVQGGLSARKQTSAKRPASAKVGTSRASESAGDRKSGTGRSARR